MSESDDDRDQRRRIEWIERKGGSVTAREVQQGHRRYRTADDADAVAQMRNLFVADLPTVVPADRKFNPTSLSADVPPEAGSGSSIFHPSAADFGLVESLPRGISVSRQFADRHNPGLWGPHGVR